MSVRVGLEVLLCYCNIVRVGVSSCNGIVYCMLQLYIVGCMYGCMVWYGTSVMYVCVYIVWYGYA